MKNNQNILVIHPLDPTTDFLSFIYKDINATVIRQPISKSRLKKLIKEADRVIMLGHGTEQGLGVVLSRHSDGLDMRLIIDSSFVYLLREKKDSVYIWCNADEFAKKYKLSGFSTGMFISEVEEADFFKVKTTENEIKESNEKFAKIIGSCIGENGEKIKNLLKENYIPDNDVKKYNHEKFYNFRELI